MNHHMPAEKFHMKRKIAVVTGATSGIGRGVAEALARIGFDVLAVGTRSEEAAAEALDSIRRAGAQVAYVQADVSEAEGRKAIVEGCERAFGRVDMLVNNAGVAPKQRVDILDVSEESFDWVMGVNLRGPFFLTQMVARRMIRLKQEQPDSTPMIVNISSISAYAVSPARAQYCISKAGMSMMTALYAHRLAEHGVRVYEIRPGIVESNMTAAVKEKYDKLIAEGLTPIARWGTSEDVGLAVAAIAQGYFPFSTGEVINVDGGFHLRRL